MLLDNCQNLLILIFTWKNTGKLIIAEDYKSFHQEEYLIACPDTYSAILYQIP